MTFVYQAPLVISLKDVWFDATLQGPENWSSAQNMMPLPEDRIHNLPATALVV